MKIMDSNKLCDNFKIGDEIWACTYAYVAQNGNGEKFTLLPTRGVLMPCRHEKDYQNSGQYIDYFIPFKKDGKSLSWQKAIKAYSLCYASTEDECKEIYNDFINSKIEWHKNEIKRLKKSLV